VKIQLVARFDHYGPSCLSKAELASHYDLRRSTSLPALFRALQTELGVTLSASLLARLDGSPGLLIGEALPFQGADIEGFTLRTRHLLDEVLGPNLMVEVSKAVAQWEAPFDVSVFFVRHSSHCFSKRPP
jgi:hypothetical protein